MFEVSGLRFGLNVCYDLRFPEGAAAVAAQGADLLVAPCNNMFSSVRAEQWKHVHNEIRAERAKETGLWLLSSDVTGARDGKVSYGPTALIDPNGDVADQVPAARGRYGGLRDTAHGSLGPGPRNRHLRTAEV